MSSYMDAHAVLLLVNVAIDVPLLTYDLALGAMNAFLASISNIRRHPRETVDTFMDIFSALPYTK